MDEEQKTQRGLSLIGDEAPKTQPPGLAFDELKTVPPSGRVSVPRPSPSPTRGVPPQSSPSSRGVAPPVPPSRSGVPAVSRPGPPPLVPSAARPISSPGLPAATRPSGAPEPSAPPPVAAAPTFSDEDQMTRRALSKDDDADETQTQRGLSTVGDEAGSKTPAYGLRKLKPLRDKLDGKPPDNFGPIQVRKQRSTPVDDFDELKLDEGSAEAPLPGYASPENTQRVALSGETMRVTLERMARIAEGVPEPEDISVVWGGRVALAPKRAAAAPLPKGVRVVLAVLLFAALAFVGSRAAQLAVSAEGISRGARAGG